MIATREELINTRMGLLKEMDSFIRDKIDDEDIVMIWLMNGLPDGYDEIDLQEIAEDEEAWKDCVDCFSKCYKLTMAE